MSLIERAAAMYHFDEPLRRGPAPRPAEAVAADAPVLVTASIAPAPVPAPAPSAAPRQRATARVDREALLAQGFILPDAATTALAEECRIVKRTLLLNAFGKRAIDKGRIILVSSSHPNEGKTFCAVNLSLSMANERDVEVVLVDGDFAKPDVLSTLGIEGTTGMIDAILDPSIDIETLLIRTDVGNLAILPAGRFSNDATELLASDRTRLLLERLSAVPNRIVIFDSPPTLVASPASVLAYYAGQVLMVVRADKTTEEELRDAVLLLGGCSNIQLLLNGTRFAPNSRRFGSYYGYETEK